MPRPIAIALAVVWLGYLAVASFVIAVDPFDLFPWGRDVTVPGDRQPFEAPRLVRMAARDASADTILIGTSPTTMYSASDIAESFPGSRRAWNISYHRGTAYDRQITIQQFIRYSRASTFIITLDFFYAGDDDRAYSEFPDYLYDNNPTHVLREVNIQSAKAAVKALRFGSPFPDGLAMERHEKQFNDDQHRQFHDPAKITALRRAIERYRHIVAAPGRTHCTQFPLLAPLFEDLRILSSRGARVFVYVPTYSPIAYYESEADPQFHRLAGASMLWDQMQMRRCVVDAAAAIHNVHVYASDDDPNFLSDYSNFRDTTHLYGRISLMHWLKMADDRRYELTPRNIDAYVNSMIGLVKNYEFYSSDPSDLPGPPLSGQP